MDNSKKAFSLVEIIITISIVVIISVVGVTSMDSIEDKSNNSKIISDISTLKNGFTSYFEEKKDYPMPKGNLQFYGDDTSYRHSYEESFGVSGFVTEDTLPKKYLNHLPLDPKTGQYYAYGKTKDTPSFEIAGVIFENNNPESFVSGNWKGEFGPQNLVKEYAGPNFVYDKSVDFFPYNPYEKMLVARISSYSGTVLINDKTLSNDEILSYNLGEGDKVNVGTGGIVNLYYSDGSNSVLGDTTTNSEVVLANMKFVEDNNLFTQVKLALNVGSLWTKASKLSDKSDFEVYTTDAVAAVRGTIFGLKKDSGNSNIVVQEGKVEVKNIVLPASENIVDKIKSGENIGTSFTNDFGIMTIEDTKSYIKVNSGSGAKGIKVNTTYPTYPTSSTGSIDKIPTEGKRNIIDNIPDLSENIVIEPIAYTQSGITLKITPILQKAQKLKYIKPDNSTGSLLNTWSSTGILSLTGGSFPPPIGTVITSLNGKYELLFCSESNGKDYCTKKLILNISNQTNFVAERQFIDSCEPEIDNLYKKYFNRKPRKNECETILEKYKNKDTRTTISKEDIIKNMMNGEDCFTYQKRFGVLYGTGYINCKPIYSNIGGEKVQNLLAGKGYNVVAYAPYNENINLHNTGGTSVLGTLSGALLDTGLYIKYNTSSGMFEDTNAGVLTLANANLNNLGFSVSKKEDVAIYQWGNFGKGIFLDNNNAGGNNDYLKYYVSELGLNSGSGFAIEMSVRGGALKRNPPTTTYYLFYLGNFRSYLLNGNLINKVGNQSSIKISDAIDTNKFYKVIVEYNNGLSNIYIYDGFKQVSQNEGLAITSTIGNELFIGSNSSKSSQWNDIIDYVKVYRK